MKQNNSILRIIPNFLTLFRSLAAIILPIIIIYGDEIGALIATPILILAGISDLLKVEGINKSTAQKIFNFFN